MTPPLSSLVITVSEASPTAGLEALPTESIPAARTEAASAPLLGALTSFFSTSLSRAGESLLRRAGFFAGKQGNALDESLPVPVEVQQSCGNTLTVVGGSIFFPDQRINTSVTRYFTLSNTNNCSVAYNINGGTYGFQISPSSGTISANSTLSIGITFTPSEARAYNGSATVNPGGASIMFNGRGIQ